MSDKDLLVYNGYVIERVQLLSGVFCTVRRADEHIWLNTGYVTTEAALIDAKAIVDQDIHKRETVQ